MPINDSVLAQLQRMVRRHVAPRRHTALLVAIIAAVAARAVMGDARVGTVVFSTALLFLLLLAIYNIQVEELVGHRETLIAERRRRNIAGWVLVVPAIAERMVVAFVPNHLLYVAGSIWWFLLLSFITWNQLRGVLRQKEVTGETISMSVSVYLLFGMTWGFLYIILYHLQAQAFSIPGSAVPNSGAPSEQQIFPVLIYFSLTTLSTIGFGDITPVSLQARYAAVAEGIAGQFYLAILVARLVGMQMTQSVNQRAESQTPHSGTKESANEG